jgi:hypothetical protein
MTPNPQQQSSDPWDAVGTTPAASAATTAPTPTASPNPSSDPWDAVPTSTPNSTSTSAAPSKPGFLSTAASDVAGVGKALFTAPAKAVAYGIAGQPHEDVANELQQKQEAHKTAVYQQFKNDFHSGKYVHAFLGLADLFNPQYGDPNDPLNQMAEAQWASSKLAKDRMLEAAKKGDTLAVIQHAAGVVPVASQVDSSIERYRQEPTRENLAHVVTSAIPAFVPSMIRGAARVAPVISDAVAPAVDAVKEKITPSSEGVVNQVLKGEKVAQPGAQAAVRGGVQSSVDSANASAAAREAAANASPAETVKVPDEYKSLVDEALKQEPAWTPAKAQPVVKALGDNYELRGSVAEGKVSDNDLDIWQKSGKLSDAADDLKTLGFKRVGKTQHGETWTNESTGQNVDLWDSAHEPKVGLGADAETELANEEPVTTTSRKSSDVGDAPILQGRKSIVDDHLETLAENEKAAYRQMDDAAGFDVKALKDRLAKDQYNLKQLGSSDPDKTGRLVEAINDSTDRIAEAEQKMKDAGVDPSLADSLHKQRMAGGDFRDSLIKNSNPDGSVNIKGLWKDTKAMRTSEYGDRLEQFFGGKEAADEYQAKLVAMDKLGAQALTRQRIAKLVGGYLAYKLGGHLFGMATNAAINVP